MAASDSRRHVAVSAVVIVIGLLIASGWYRASTTTRDALVVYCAHDLLYAEEVLRDFEQQTGIPVVIVPDTEATKSLGLVQRLIREKEHPACDVFWNNQLLGTVELAERGVLEPYQGLGWQRMPDRFREPTGLWSGFGGRLRVWIVNTDKMHADVETIDERLSGDLSRMALAEPMFGTTLSHFAVLWQFMGADEVQSWFLDMRSRGMQVVPGNATVKDLVAAGVCDFGMTDTDDYFLAQDEGAPVAMLPIRIDSGETICIPNSVAIIRGTQKRRQAEQLVDYLLSEAVELRLAASKARQIPLGTVDESALSKDVRRLSEWAKESVELTHLANVRREALEWLTSEQAP
ncbi:MAG: extracellular solute-binding protein [Planctomycetaceae bacterium]|nr:extracellular solute-binding protein [Planctomycetaceae bacterium]